MGTQQFFIAEHELNAVREPFHGQVDETSHPRGLSAAAAVVKVEVMNLGPVFEQQRHQLAGTDQRGCRGNGHLSNDLARQDGIEFKHLVISAKRWAHMLLPQVVTHFDAPGHDPAKAVRAKGAAAVRVELMQPLRHPVLAQVPDDNTGIRP